MRSDLSLHVSVLLVNITLNVGQMFYFDQNSTKEAQIMSSLTKAYHTSKDIIARLLLVRVVEVSQIESLRDSD